MRDCYVMDNIHTLECRALFRIYDSTQPRLVPQLIQSRNSTPANKIASSRRRPRYSLYSFLVSKNRFLSKKASAQCLSLRVTLRSFVHNETTRNKGAVNNLARDASATAKQAAGKRKATSSLLLVPSSLSRCL